MVFSLWVYEEGWKVSLRENLDERPWRSRRLLNQLVLKYSGSTYFIETPKERLLLPITGKEHRYLLKNPAKGFEYAVEKKIVLGEGTYGYVFRWERQNIAIKISSEIGISLNEYSLVRYLRDVPHIVPFYAFEYLPPGKLAESWSYYSPSPNEPLRGPKPSIAIYMKWMDGGDWDHQLSKNKNSKSDGATDHKERIGKMMYQLIKTIRACEKR
jgi:serine/threonine protein kinase